MHKLNVVKEVVGKQGMNSDNLFEGSQQGLFRQGILEHSAAPLPCLLRLI